MTKSKNPPEPEATPEAEESRPTVLYVFPFLAIAAIAYAALILSVGPDQVDAMLDRRMFELAIASRSAIQFLIKDAFVFVVLLLLFCEIWKASVNETRTFMNHTLSFVVALICVYSLLRFDGFGTITFLYITLATVFDVAAGVYITSRSKPRHEPAPVFEFSPKKRGLL